MADLAVISNLLTLYYLGGRIGADYPMLRAYFEFHLASPAIIKRLKEEVFHAEKLGLDSSWMK